MSPAATGQAGTVDMGTAFTYQGRLQEGDGPAEGIYDLHFELYDDPDAGSMLGTVTVEDQAGRQGSRTPDS